MYGIVTTDETIRPTLPSVSTTTTARQLDIPFCSSSSARTRLVLSRASTIFALSLTCTLIGQDGQ